MKILFISTGRRNEEIVNALERRGVEVINLVRAGLLKIFYKLLFADYDIVHIDNAFMKAFLASSVSKLRRKKSTCLVRGYGDHYHRKERGYGFLKRLKYALSENLSFLLLDHVFFISKDTEKRIMENFTVKSSSIAPNGYNIPDEIDEINIRRVLKDDYHIKIDENDIILITVTNLKFEPKYWGIKVLNKAMKKLPDNMWLLVLGDGKYLDLLKNESNDNLIFLGFKKDVLRWLNSSDIFVYCSFLDAFPTVMLEAQSAGLPVVANDIGGIPETGKYVIISSSTPDDFARKIEPLIEDEQLRKKMGELNKKWIYEHDWDWAVNNYITVWRKL